MTVLEIINAKAANLSYSSNLVSMAIEEVGVVIRNYCNQEPEWAIPTALDYTWANMALDLLAYEKERLIPIVDVAIGVIENSDISSLRIGDTTVALGGSGGTTLRSKALRSHQQHLDDITMNYRQQLTRFRRMAW